MKDSKLGILEIEFHPNAKEKINKFIDDLSDLLYYQSSALALREKADMVLSPHVDEALSIIESKKQKRWLNDISKAVGAAFLGAAIAGLRSALSQVNMNEVLFFAVLLAIGGPLVLFGALWRGS